MVIMILIFLFNQILKTCRFLSSFNSSAMDKQALVPCRKKGEEDIIIELPAQIFLKPKKENLILTTAF